MWAKKLKIVFLLLAGCLGVLSTVLPHHHHADGMICLELTIPGCDDSHSQPADDDPSDCTTCNWFSYKNPVDLASLHQHHMLKFAPVKILLGTWAVLPDLADDTPDESPAPGIYIERLHTAVVLKTLGLRAPPVA
ncbi:MAG TPA: hypothetical protein H9969_09280 [Candidatus Barnesiella merdipullorum]|nr:hypothetical protein [Candidatus Barnesiella merdipullorum]